jgi:3-oxoacyl-[acyl-carrier-protein] synthase-1
LDAQERLHSDACIWGFCPGEAAGFCLLASPRSPLLSRRPALLDILALSTAREPKAANAGGVCIGEGLTAAFHGALSGLAGGQRVAHTLCDMNGEVWRADEYGFAVLRTTEHFTDEAEYDAPATGWGDVGAASVPLLLGLVATAMQRPARGTHTLVASSSLGDLRGAVLVEARLA